MLLAVTPTVEETEHLRRVYAKLHCFVHCAVYKNMVRSAEKFRPDVILLKIHDVTDELVRKMERVREILPDVALITLANVDTSALSPNLAYSHRVQKLTLQYQSVFCAPMSPNAAATRGGLIVSGLLMLPFDTEVFLFGHRAHFTPEEVFLLRYLAENHPRRISSEELGSYCFTYGKKTPRSSVASRISRINKEAQRVIGLPIITLRRDEGYGIDF